MKTDLVISPDLSLPIDFVTKTCAILAQRRKGKTYTASLIAEELVRCEMPWVALDPTGAWWGLRAGADGAPTGGLPVTILGGAHGDVPLERTSGHHVAELVIETPSWYILDLSLFETRAAERQFSYEFADALYRRKGHAGRDFPLHLFVDEADMFVPQERERDDNLMLGAFQSIVRRGGLRGLGTTLISQRPALVNKSVLVQLDMLVLLRLVAGNDQDYLEKNYVKRAGTAEQVADLMGSLASLRLGEAWVWEPGADPMLFQRVQMRERHTFNSSATPKPGEKRVEPRGLVDVDLDALKEAMAATIERATADDPKALRRRIIELEKALKTAPTVPVIEVREVDKIVEVAVLPPGLDDAIALVRYRTNETLDEFAVLINDLRSVAQRVNKPADKPPTQSISQPPRPAPRQVIDKDTSADTITGPQRKLLTVLATYGPRTKRQLALQSGYSENGGGFNNPLGKLRSSGYVTKGTSIEITGDGLAALGDYDPLPTGQDLVDHWMSQLPGPAGKILAPLVAAWPNSMTKEDLAAAAGYDPHGGGFNNPLGKLRTLGLVTKGPDISLTDEFGEAIS